MKTNKLKLAISLFVIVLFASCKSSSEAESNTRAADRSQRGQPSVEQLMEKMDANKDGRLSMAEVKGPLKNDFSKIDADQDGFLSATELKNAPKPERREGQGRPGRNGNGF